MIHDWAFTDSHYILFGNRIKLDVAGNYYILLVCRLAVMICNLGLSNPETGPDFQMLKVDLMLNENTGSMTAVCGLSPMITALSLNPSKPTSPIYLLPRFPNSQPTRDWRIPIEAPSQLWVLHVGNAFEERDVNGNLEIQIQASGCSYQWFNFQKMFGK